MSKKYHWSYESAMNLVDEWAEQFGADLSPEAYEALVQSIADDLEAQRELGKGEGRSEAAAARRASPYGEYPSPYHPRRPDYWLGPTLRR